MNRRTIAFALVFSFMTAVCGPRCGSISFAADKPTAGSAAVTEEQAAEIALEAYYYFYPLITMDLTRRQLTNIEPGKMPGRGPMNTFSHVREFPPAEFREVVRPNFDTLYSTGWLDLTTEPMVVSAPDTAGRFYLLPMLDMWTDVFASPGKRTTGTQAGQFAVVLRGWKGELPAGITRIESPTPYVWVIGRTQTNGTQDYDAVRKIQDGYTITPLSRLGKTPQPVVVKIDPTVDMKTSPMLQVNSMPAARFFNYGAALMQIHPPHITDQPILARMKRLGIEAGQEVKLEQMDPIVRRALEQAPARGLKAMQAKLLTLAPVIKGWQMNTDTMGVYGNYYLKRAIVSMVGLGANLPEDATYPMNFADQEGKPLDGSHKYKLRFEKPELPPVEAFWSITLYDPEGFQVKNPLNRFAIGDRDALKFNADGSVDLYIQHESPGKELESNWLPAPQGPFNITMRLYAPKSQAITGEWTPPPVQRLK